MLLPHPQQPRSGHHNLCGGWPLLCPGPAHSTTHLVLAVKAEELSLGAALELLQPAGRPGRAREGPAQPLPRPILGVVEDVMLGPRGLLSLFVLVQRIKLAATGGRL